jgi:hypothetical protein
MAILKLEPQNANNTANFAFGNVFAANYYYSNGVIFSGGGGSGTVKYTANSNPPSSNNSPGDQWFNTTSQVLYEYINDGTGNYWVDILTPSISTQTGTLPAIITSGTSNLAITPNGNITLNVTGTSNAVVFSTSSVNAIGSLVTSNALYAKAAYTGAYTTGIVVDYASSNGRFSVDSGAGINFYNNGVANSTIFSINSVGNANVAGALTVNNGASIVGNLSTGNIAITGNMTLSGALTLQQTYEVVTTITGATGTVTHDFSIAGTYYHVTPAGAWVLNITNIPLINNRIFVVAFIVNQGSTGYLPSSYQINTSTQTVKWVGGAVPVASNSKYDIVSLSCLYTGSGWTVFGQAASYA